MKKLQKAFRALPTDCCCEILLFYSEWKDYFAFCRVNKKTWKCLTYPIHWYSCKHVVFRAKDLPTKQLEYVRNLMCCQSKFDQNHGCECFPNLRVLEGGSKNIGNGELRVLVAGCKQLTVCDVRCCQKITDEGIKLLADGCKQLIYVNVSWCWLITDEGIVLLAAGCKQLTHLDVYGCKKITDEGIKALAAGCKQLTSLDVGYCQLITDEGVKALADGCTQLTDLNAWWCRSIRNEGIKAVKKMFPNLKIRGVY